MVSLLLVANVVNLGADLSAMGAAMALLVGGNGGLYTLLFGILCIGLEVGLSYPRYASVLKWTTLHSVHLRRRGDGRARAVAARAALSGRTGTAVECRIRDSAGGDSRARRSARIFSSGRRARKSRSNEGIISSRFASRRATLGPELKRIRIDTLTGMAFSTIVSLAIVFATAATLHANGIRDIADIAAGG